MITNVSITSQIYQDGSLLLAELHRLELEPFDCRPQSYAGPIYQVGDDVDDVDYNGDDDDDDDDDDGGG